MKCFRVAHLLVLLGPIILGSEVSAQQSERIGGVVVDETGVAIPGATVVAGRMSTFSEWTQTVRVETDSAGEFSVDLPAPITSRGRSVCLACQHPQFALAAVWNPEDHVRVILQPKMQREISVLDPTGKPLGGVRLEIMAIINDEKHYLPLARDLAMVDTNQDGVATIDMVSANSGFVASVRSDDWGDQFQNFVGAAAHTTLQLSPVGSIQGQLVLPAGVEPVDLADVSIRAYSRAPGGITGGMAAVTSDAVGAFKIEKIAASEEVSLVVETPHGFPYYLTSRPSVALKAGETSQLNVEFVAGVQVTGIVLASETEQPVANVEVNVGNQHLSTDDEGRYRCTMRPGRAYARVVEVPQGYLDVGPYLNHVTGGEASQTEPIEMPPIYLEKCKVLRGHVVDEAGSPVPGVSVAATWKQPTGNNSWTTPSVSELTDESGAFELGVSTRESVWCVAYSDDQSVLEPIECGPDANDVRFELVSAASFRLRGRVLNEGGNPIAFAKVTVRKNAKNRAVPGAWNAGHFTTDLRTDSNGEFDVGHALPRYNEYFLEASADGYLKRKTDAIDEPSGDAPADIEIVLQAAVVVEGTVVDADGTPVAGVRVFAESANRNEMTQVLTEADGTFRLLDLKGSLPLVFTEHPDYFTSGAAIGSGPVQIQLTRRDAPIEEWPARTLETSRLPHDVRTELATALVEAMQDRVEHWSYLIEPMIEIDAEAAANWFDKLDRPTDRARLLIALQEPIDALAEAESIEGDYRRALSLAEFSGSVEPEMRDRFLERALAAARSTGEPDKRVYALSEVALALLDAGREDEAEQLLKSVNDMAKQLARNDWSAFARGTAGALVALFDMEAGMDLMDVEKDAARYHGNAAVFLASRDPAAAKRMLDQIGETRFIRYTEARVAYAVASQDAVLAEKIARSAQRDYERAIALGAVAVALRGSDKTTATRLLDDAFTLCDGQSHRLAYAQQLVRFTELVEPRMLDHVIWRTLSMYRTPEYPSGDAARQKAEVAISLARPYLLMAAYGWYPELTAKAGAAFREMAAPVAGHDPWPIFAVAAMTDPEATIAWLPKLYDAIPEDRRSILPMPWAVALQAMSSDADGLWDLVAESDHGWRLGQRSD